MARRKAQKLKRKNKQWSHRTCERFWLKKTESLQKEILPSDQYVLNICLAVLTCRHWFDWLDEVTQRIIQTPSPELHWQLTVTLARSRLHTWPDTETLSFAALSFFSHHSFFFFFCFLSASGDDGWNKGRWGGGERRGCRPQVWTGVRVHC